MNSATFKIRGGKPTYLKPDGTIGTAGKGPLVGEEFAFTISTTHDQHLIAPPQSMNKTCLGLNVMTSPFYPDGGAAAEIAPTLSCCHDAGVALPPPATRHAYPINSMVIGKNNPSATDRQTLGIGEDGDPSPTIQTQHHHAVALAYDAWNQTANPETVQTLRTSNGTEGDNRMPKVMAPTLAPPQQPTQPSRMTINYVSLFAGIEAFSVAASRIEGVDWNPIFFSEIDPFPCAVLAHHFHSVPNLGDVCKIRVEERTNPETNTKEKVITNGSTTIPFPRDGIHILAGGSPCQDVSVAGLRRGMQEGSGTRSSLAFEYSRLVRELAPRVLLWENVPGVLSSNGGRDFGCFLDSLDELGYSDLAYAVLDAQYVGSASFPNAVPQRRRRVFVVGVRSLGRSGADVPVAATVLSLWPRVCRNPPPRRQAGQGFAAPPGYGPARDDRVVGGAGYDLQQFGRYGEGGRPPL